MNWQWNSKPPMSLQIEAGHFVDIALDVTSPCGTRVPQVDWDTTRMGEAILEPSERDSRRVRIFIPSTQHGFFRLSYHLEGEQSTTGIIHIRVPQAPNTVALDTFPTPRAPIEADTLLPFPEPLPTIERQSQDDDFFHCPTQTSTDTPPTDAEDGSPHITEPKISALVLQQPIFALPPGEYAIEIARKGVVIQNLSQPIPRHRVLVIGRFSREHDTIPDVDLSGHFGSSEEEALCSRRQAELFWRGDALILRNLGANPLVLNTPEQTNVEIYASLSWQLGQCVELPGGLVLCLARRADG